MPVRLNILPDERISSLSPSLENRLLTIAEQISPENFPSLCDSMIRYVLEQGFHLAGADSELIWLLDRSRENLVPCFGIGEAAEKLTLNYSQPLREGIIGMVMASEQPFVENEVFKNERHSKIVDMKLRQQTYAMIVVPFYFLRQCRGVISCVQLKNADSSEVDPPGFRVEHLQAIQRAGALVSELIDYHLLRQTVQW
jgi:hypothetical protein